MKHLTPFLTTLLALVSSFLPLTTAKTSDDTHNYDIGQNMYPITNEEFTTNHLLFQYTLEEFMIMWTRQEAEWGITDLDWSTNGCDHVIPGDMCWDFTPACIRHGFGYLNFARQNRLTKATQEEIDKLFKEDMYRICSQARHKHGCRAAAKTFYAKARAKTKWEHPFVRSVPVDAISADINATFTNATAAENANAATAMVEGIVDRVAGGYWFLNWLAVMTAHPEILEAMTDRALDTVEMTLDVGIEEMEKMEKKADK